MNEDTNEIMLYGLEGGNLLGFLAAIGTLRVVSENDPQGEWKLGWRENDGWRPVVSSNKTLTQDSLIEILTIALEAARNNNQAFEIGKNLTFSPDKFRCISAKAQATATMYNRCFADFIAAFGSESLANREGKMQDTALRTMSGAGGQHFIGFMKDLVAKTEPEHLRTALCEPWEYTDDKPSLRWDPVDDRRYALRWKNPSKDPIKTVRGANRLAVEALPLLPTAPANEQLHTTGFTQRDGKVLFSWPIWNDLLRMEVVISLLSLSELQASSPNRARLDARGIVDVYRSQRITEGKYRNFTSAVPV